MKHTEIRDPGSREARPKHYIKSIETIVEHKIEITRQSKSSNVFILKKKDTKTHWPKFESKYVFVYNPICSIIETR